jgi:signal transduction histidine kinase
VQDQLPFEAELIGRIDWLIRLRWLAVAGTAVAAGLGAFWFPGVLALAPLLGVTAVIALYNAQFYLYLRALKLGPSGTMRLRQATLVAYLQICLDLVALAVLVHFAGGVENPAVLFFVFHVIIASILLRRGISYVMAGLASLLYAAVGGFEYLGVVRHYHLPIFGMELYREPLFLLISMLVMALTLFLVAYLTTSITARLRERDQELLESNLTCQIRSGELEQLNEQLRRVDAERTRFMVLVTHELRAPINTIYSALELALSGYASAEKTQGVLERAQNRATELLDLIRDLLDLTRVREQAGKLEHLTPVQLDDVVQQVVDFMRVEVEEKELALDVDVAPDLVPVRALPDLAKLVWTNLLSNAVKYSEPGGSIHVSLEQDAERVSGVVRDTGIGIAPEDVPRVFDEFYRASNARLVSPHGTGVGLAIVHRVLENLGGEIRVESEPGRGSTFAFSLPRADRVVELPEAEAPDLAR